jgi:hypothetical protein
MYFLIWYSIYWIFIKTVQRVGWYYGIKKLNFWHPDRNKGSDYYDFITYEVWIGHGTYMPLKGGQWGYLSTLMDFFPRKVTQLGVVLPLNQERIAEAF